MWENNYARYELAGVVVIDADWTGEKIHEISVVANEKTAPITGMWQVSGRSDITDFEEVVRAVLSLATTFCTSTVAI